MMVDRFVSEEKEHLLSRMRLKNIRRVLFAGCAPLNDLALSRLFVLRTWYKCYVGNRRIEA
jgi:hypothetical protein